MSGVASEAKSKDYWPFLVDVDSYFLEGFAWLNWKDEDVQEADGEREEEQEEEEEASVVVVARRGAVVVLEEATVFTDSTRSPVTAAAAAEAEADVGETFLVAVASPTSRPDSNFLFRPPRLRPAFGPRFFGDLTGADFDTL